MRLLIGLQYTLAVIPPIVVAAIGLAADDPYVVVVALVVGVLAVAYVAIRIHREGP